MKSVLVVDDDADVRALLSATLAQRGHRVLEAPDGATALRVARAEAPDVVLLDVLMPRMDGVAVCRALKTDPRTRSGAVVVLTGVGTADARDQAMTAGANAFVTKPFSPLDLLDEVEHLLGGGR